MNELVKLIKGAFIDASISILKEVKEQDNKPKKRQKKK